MLRQALGIANSISKVVHSSVEANAQKECLLLDGFVHKKGGMGPKFVPQQLNDREHAA
jgi:hypothetical protein